MPGGIPFSSNRPCASVVVEGWPPGRKTRSAVDRVGPGGRGPRPANGAQRLEPDGRDDGAFALERHPVRGEGRETRPGGRRRGRSSRPAEMTEIWKAPWGPDCRGGSSGTMEVGVVWRLPRGSPTPAGRLPAAWTWISSGDVRDRPARFVADDADHSSRLAELERPVALDVRELQGVRRDAGSGDPDGHRLQAGGEVGDRRRADGIGGRGEAVGPRFGQAEEAALVGSPERERGHAEAGDRPVIGPDDRDRAFRRIGQDQAHRAGGGVLPPAEKAEEAASARPGRCAQTMRGRRAFAGALAHDLHADAPARSVTAGSKASRGGFRGLRVPDGRRGHPRPGPVCPPDRPPGPG